MEEIVYETYTKNEKFLTIICLIVCRLKTKELKTEKSKTLISYIKNIWIRKVRCFDVKTNIVSVKYEDEYTPKTFNGRTYSYYTNINLNVGDIVVAPTKNGDKIARVSEINIPEYKVEMIKFYLKTIEKKLDKNKYLYQNEVLQEVA